jgi:succinate dehydrogenase / fumarate reductase, membrane anchor subunit
MTKSSGTILNATQSRSLRSPLGRVIGLGSAKEGVHHWWVQRLTSVALVPLGVWFTVSLLSLPAFDHTTVVAWMAQSWTALLLILFVLIGTWHSQLGVRVVVEDYVHGGSKPVVLVIVTFAHTLIAAAGVFAVLKVAFGGAA